jgi:hypothetical protein
MPSTTRQPLPPDEADGDGVGAGGEVVPTGTGVCVALGTGTGEALGARVGDGRGAPELTVRGEVDDPARCRAGKTPAAGCVLPPECGRRCDVDACARPGTGGPPALTGPCLAGTVATTTAAEATATVVAAAVAIE